MQVRNRPRIPTPDVTKEVVDCENRMAANVASFQNQMTGISLIQNYPSYPGSDNTPVLQVVLSPIKELESGSVNNTLHPHQPGTNALAQAVLNNSSLGSVLTAPVNVPLSVSQLTSLGLASVHNSPLLTRPTFTVQTFTEETPKVEEVLLEEDKDEKELVSRRSDVSDASTIGSRNSGATVSITEEKTPLTSFAMHDGSRSRKTSVVSESKEEKSSKRSEVYV